MRRFLALILLILSIIPAFPGVIAIERPGFAKGGGTGGGGNVAFTALHTYFMSPTGNDSNNGTSPSTPWLTPNHSVVCGDVIVAAAGTYPGASFDATFGTVSNCPSSSGGIDNLGQIYFAVVLCGGADLESCNVNVPDPSAGVAGSREPLVKITTDNWAVEGFKVGNAPNDARSFEAKACDSGTQIIHHTAFINDISWNSKQGFDTNECAINHNVPGNGDDYFAVVGSIAQNSAQDGQCLAAFDAVAPAAFDNVAGTHIFFYGGFAIANNTSDNGCGIDEEAFLADTWDAHGYANKGVYSNNIAYKSTRFGFQFQDQEISNAVPTIKVYNNTFFSDNTNAASGQSDDADFNTTGNGGSLLWNVTAQNNIVYQPNAHYPNGNTVYASVIGGGTWTSFTFGGTGNENILLGAATTCDGTSGCNSASPPFSSTAYNGNSLGTNFYVNPSFSNTADLLSNRVGVPTCHTVNVTQCMGWNAGSSTLTSPSVIADVAAGCTQCTGKGYQRPSTNCVTSGPFHDDYPTWLKGIVYLHWNGTSITENADLVTKPCGM